MMCSPVLSFNATSLVPVTPMYDNGIITAFLISSPVVQEIVPVIGNWEGPFLNLLWCYNWCGTDCTANFGTYTSTWSSMHFMLRDHSLNTCPEHCSSGSGSSSSSGSAAEAALMGPMAHKASSSS